MDIRPTADVVKEAVFNIIQFDIEGRRVLDLFAARASWASRPFRAARQSAFSWMRAPRP